MLSPRILALTVIIVGLSTAAGLAAWATTEQIAVTVLVAISFAIHLTLLSILTRVWLVERFPKVKAFLERIPGVSFSVPVPDNIRAVSRTVQPPRRGSSSVNDPVAVESRFQKPDPAPFTLATAEFEPPEPIKPIQAEETTVPVLPGEQRFPPLSSVEKAFRKSQHQSRHQYKNTQLQRLHTICRVLKQFNQEVAIWTEGELATLANTMLSADDGDKEILALLMPQNVVKLNGRRTFEFEHHAGVLNAILLATGSRLDVSFVNSDKDANTGQCSVNFEYRGRPITWRFFERGDRLSEKFLSNALMWVGSRARGQFLPLDAPNGQIQLVFVVDDVWQAIKQGSIA